MMPDTQSHTAQDKPHEAAFELPLELLKSSTAEDASPSPSAESDTGVVIIAGEAVSLDKLNPPAPDTQSATPDKNKKTAKSASKAKPAASKAASSKQVKAEKSEKAEKVEKTASRSSKSTSTSKAKPAASKAASSKQVKSEKSEKAEKVEKTASRSSKSASTQVPAEKSAKPVAETPAETAPEKAAKPAAETPVEAAPVTPIELIAETAPEAPAEPVAETAAEVAPEAVAETAPEVPAEATAESAAETPAEATAESAAETPAESAPEAPVEATPEAPAETAPEVPVEPAVEAPAPEAAPEAPAEAVAEPVSVPDTPTEPVAETPAEPTPEAPAEPIAEAPAAEPAAETAPEAPAAEASAETAPEPAPKPKSAAKSKASSKSAKSAKSSKTSKTSKSAKEAKTLHIEAVEPTLETPEPAKPARAKKSKAAASVMLNTIDLTAVSSEEVVKSYTDTIQEYIEFALAKPNSIPKPIGEIVDESESEERSIDEIRDMISQTKRLKDAATKSFANMIEALEERLKSEGIQPLTDFVAAIMRVYEEYPTYASEITSTLIASNTRKLFFIARQSDFAAVFPLLNLLNFHFRLSRYFEYTLSPTYALFGFTSPKADRGINVKYPPLSSDDIHGILDVLLATGSTEQFDDWLFTILTSHSTNISESYRTEYTPAFRQLRSWAFAQVYKTDSAYHQAALRVLFDEKRLSRYLGNSRSARINEDPPVLEDNSNEIISQLQDQLRLEVESHDRTRTDLQNSVNTRNADLIAFRAKYDELGAQYKTLNERYERQIEINERVIRDDNILLDEKSEELLQVQTALQKANETIQIKQLELSALRSDYDLQSNELTRARDALNQDEQKSRDGLLRDIISGITDQLVDLRKFFLELLDTGRLEDDSIELFDDTLVRIEEEFTQYGCTRIGTLEETVPYDSSLHDSMGERIANGESVMVCGYGWIIGGKVFIKAPVERIP